MVEIIDSRPEVMTIVSDYPNNTKVEWKDSIVYTLSSGFQYQIWDGGIHQYTSTIAENEEYGNNTGKFAKQSLEDWEQECDIVEAAYLKKEK